jgi:hypothetical protein
MVIHASLMINGVRRFLFTVWAAAHNRNFNSPSTLRRNVSLIAAIAAISPTAVFDVRLIGL